MYLEFFGLNKPPFKITPDTKAFYTGADRGAVLGALSYAVMHGEGIIKVVGEVGSGKTMLCRMLLSKLSKQVDWIYIANPSVSPEHTLFIIAEELGLQVPDSLNKYRLMSLIQRTLLARHQQNRRVAVVVEEAQSMPLESLEEIRLLSNLETDDHKLLQILLFGQPELNDNLADHRIRQLRERITDNFNLGPLPQKEVCSYLNFRLRAAGYTGADLFSKAVAKAIYKRSEGIVRRINILADKTLLSAYVQDRHELSVRDVTRAAEESAFSQKKSWWSKRKNKELA